VLTLESQEGRMFTPLAYTKTLTMLVAAALVITLDPALRVLFTACGASSSGRRGCCRSTTR
jgi:Cu(I)/Ag(I) efflux system membrane protein CusA/SilA